MKAIVYALGLVMVLSPVVASDAQAYSELRWVHKIDKKKHNAAVHRKWGKKAYYKSHKKVRWAKRHWKKRYAVKPSKGNLFRRYAAASASRSCLQSHTRALLEKLEAKVGKVSVISTCRPGATIAGTGRPSYHRYGMAVDFNTPRKSEAIAFLRSQGVFVMTYCGMTHVHFNHGQTGYSGCGVKSRTRYARRSGLT